MEESDLRIFVQTVPNFFKAKFNEEVIVDPPFLRRNESILQDYTGTIGISGKHRGAVYFTTSRGMVGEMLNALHEEGEMDLVGEVANTISGNVRRAFGKDFLISVPNVVEGNTNKIEFPDNAQAFIIPFVWREHHSYLIVALGPSEVEGIQS
ncbi:MAG: chemotaxis protein CheX [Verrucomicrobiota bacterium]